MLPRSSGAAAGARPRRGAIAAAAAARAVASCDLAVRRSAAATLWQARPDRYYGNANHDQKLW